MHLFFFGLILIGGGNVSKIELSFAQFFRIIWYFNRTGEMQFDGGLPHLGERKC